MPYFRINHYLLFNRVIHFFLKKSTPRKSAFVKELSQNVFNLIQPKGLDSIEAKRILLKQDQRRVDFKSFGAPSKAISNKPQKVSAIARTSLASSKEAELAGRLASYCNADTIIELGTNLGISTAYLAHFNRDATIWSFEGNAELIDIAREHCPTPHFVVGNIDKTLPNTLKEIERIDFAVIDANHTYDATINYFNQILAKCHNNSCIVIDDIYWSKGMTQAWREIKSDPRVKQSIESFDCGLLFFRTDYPSSRNLVSF